MVDVNIWAILVATIIQMVLGFLWYGPLFGKIWMKEMRFDPKKKPPKGTMTKSYVIMIVSAFIMAYVLAHFVKLLSVTSLAGACQIAFWIWLGFVATIQVGSVLWEGKSWKLFAINAAYWLVGIFFMAWVLAIWP
ncbi:MAG TPA: DUF1761 domain-containing protein [Candidatus Binatia bacterium]|nr:DUF1761 domain-containing protein [Candidatus Binatia bacterium]